MRVSAARCAVRSTLQCSVFYICSKYQFWILRKLFDKVSRGVTAETARDCRNG